MLPAIDDSTSFDRYYAEEVRILAKEFTFFPSCSRRVLERKTDRGMRVSGDGLSLFLVGHGVAFTRI